MTPPTEKLAGSLDLLRLLQERGVVAVRAADLPRSHRERLVRHGFLGRHAGPRRRPPSPPARPGARRRSEPHQPTTTPATPTGAAIVVISGPQKWYFKETVSAW